MDLQLRGKRALVTGSSDGIGAGIAQILAQEGATVVIHGRREDATSRIKQEITARGGKALAIIGDLATDEGARQVAQTTLAQLGGIDILVNNVGSYTAHGWQGSSTATWADFYNSNVLSAVRMIQLLVEPMQANGWGRIIQLASGEAVQPSVAMPDYAAAKAALISMTVSLAKELANTGITVNTVSPGIVATQTLQKSYYPFAQAQGWGTEWEQIEKAIIREVAHNSVGRLGHAEDVGALVAFLVSPLAGYINGANIRVDGGSTITVN